MFSRCCQTFHKLFFISLLPLWRKGNTYSHVSGSEEVHISFSVVVVECGGTSQGSQMLNNGVWFAPWWQVAFSVGGIIASAVFVFGRFLSHAPILLCCLLSHHPLPSPPPGCFGVRADVSHRGGGGWLVTWTDTWYCRTVWECVTCSKFVFFSGGLCRPPASVMTRAMSLLSLRFISGCDTFVHDGGGGGGQSTVRAYFSQLFWATRWMWRKVKMAQDRWTRQQGSWWTG